MSKIWEAMGAIVVTIIALHMFYELLKPYAWLIALGLVFTLVGSRVYLHWRRG